jgi:hypothetical protein
VVLQLRRPQHSSDVIMTDHAVSRMRIDVRGVDLFEFADGKSTRQDSFWKIVA